MPKKPVEAYTWYAVAAAAGDQEAATRRDLVKGAMTPTELAKAQKAVDGFQVATPDAAANEVPKLAGVLVSD